MMSLIHKSVMTRHLINYFFWEAFTVNQVEIVHAYWGANLLSVMVDVIDTLDIWAVSLPIHTWVLSLTISLIVLLVLLSISHLDFFALSDIDCVLVFLKAFSQHLALNGRGLGLMGSSGF